MIKGQGVGIDWSPRMIEPEVQSVARALARLGRV